MPYCDIWLSVVQQPHAEVLILTERPDKREEVFYHVCDSVAAHLIGADILSLLGFGLSAAAVRNRLPTSKQIRSGDVGEVLATDYVHEQTRFRVPLKRLRYKDDRNTSMRGDDLIALDSTVSPPHVLKAEVKSRATLGVATVRQACATLERDRGRPRASSLAFVSMRLRESGENELAAIVEGFQDGELGLAQIHHLVFTVSGNEPLQSVEACLAEPKTAAERRFISIQVADHQGFIQSIFATLDARFA